MSNGTAYCFMTHHSPRTFREETAAAVFRPMIDGQYRVAREMAALDPDVILIMSPHWFSTFPWYAAGNPHWKGALCGTEAPDLLHGYEYDFPGHPQMAELIVRKGREAGIMCNHFSLAEFQLDYGTVVPLKYIQRKGNPWPVVPMSICLQANHDEAYRWGQAIGAAIRESGLKVAFIASGALSHDLVRNPEAWPMPEAMAADKLMIQLLEEGRLEEARQLSERYGQRHFEAWGKHLTCLTGVLSTFGEFRGECYCYGPSSGSGNACMKLTPVALQVAA